MNCFVIVLMVYNISYNEEELSVWKKNENANYLRINHARQFNPYFKQFSRLYKNMYYEFNAWCSNFNLTDTASNRFDFVNSPKWCKKSRIKHAKKRTSMLILAPYTYLPKIPFNAASFNDKDKKIYIILYVIANRT